MYAPPTRVCAQIRMRYTLQGNLEHLRTLMGWYGDKVLYFGDHVYTDLAVSICTETQKLKKINK